jgi:UDP-3-O-[3-hydroxymyristoyl] glucosamine N-acyltransferase
VGAQSGVTSDIPAGQEVLGSPAVPLAQARRGIIALSKVPELRTQVKQLQQQVEQLQQRIDELQAGRGSKERP